MSEWVGDVQREPPQRTGLVITGVIAIIAALVAVSVYASGSEPESGADGGASTSTTEFGTTTEEPATEQPPTTALTDTTPTTTTTPEPSLTEEFTLNWRRVAQFDNTPPIALVDHGEDIVVFAPVDSAAGTGLRSWRSSEGRSWFDGGELVGPEHRVDTVVSSGSTLVAAGRAAGEAAASVWVSDDGLDLDHIPLPSPELPLADAVTVIGAAGADDVFVVFGQATFDLGGRIAEFLDTGPLDRSVTYSWELDPFMVRGLGPLGIVAFEADADQVGIGDEELAALQRDVDDPAVVVWTSLDGGRTWTVNRFASPHVNAVSITPDGEFVAVGRRDAGPTSWTSRDGLVWTPWRIEGAAEHLTAVPGGVVGAEHGPRGPSLLRSTDGVNWQSSSLAGVFADAPTLRIGSIAADRAGTAAFASGFLGRVGGDPPPVAVVAERDGHELHHDPSTGQLVLVRGTDEISRITLGSGPPADSVAVDFAAETVEFATGDGGTISFAFAELSEAATSVSLGARVGQRIIHSFGGTAWTTTDVVATFGQTVGQTLLHVDDRFVVAAAGSRAPGRARTTMWIADTAFTG